MACSECVWNVNMLMIPVRSVCRWCVWQNKLIGHIYDDNDMYPPLSMYGSMCGDARIDSVQNNNNRVVCVFEREYEKLWRWQANFVKSVLRFAWNSTNSRARARLLVSRRCCWLWFFFCFFFCVYLSRTSFYGKTDFLILIGQSFTYHLIKIDYH